MPANDEAVVLTLEVTGPEAQRLGPASRKAFGAAGGTIGRADSNDWVLSHSLVSGHHATIEYADGTFYVTDTSTNGVFFNSKQNRLPKGEPEAIKNGDVLIIEPFHIRALVAGREAARPHVAPAAERAPRYAADSFADPFQVQSEAAFIPSGASPIPSESGDELDPLKLLGVAGEPAVPRSVPRAQDLDANSALADHFQPPAVSPPPPPAPRSGALIPDDYDPAAEGRESQSSIPAPDKPGPAPFSAPMAVSPHAPQPARIERPRPDVRPRPAPAEPARRAEAGNLTLAEVLAAAGLENAPVTPQLATQLGAILRVVVSGVMDVLRSRQQIKDEFRMRATRFQPEDNNPLKFSANVSDALHNLLVKRNPAYLGPVEAFEDAFDDLRNHQLAMLAGMRVAFEAMLAEFNPERLQGQFDRKVKKKSLLGGGPEAQYWEMYRERVQDLTKDVEATFRNLFGDRFVSAYEEQLDRLNPRSGGRKR